MTAQCYGALESVDVIIMRALNEWMSMLLRLRQHNIGYTADRIDDMVRLRIYLTTELLHVCAQNITFSR